LQLGIFTGARNFDDEKLNATMTTMRLISSYFIYKLSRNNMGPNIIQLKIFRTAYILLGFLKKNIYTIRTLQIPNVNTIRTTR
jgi:hypothetical protein